VLLIVLWVRSCSWFDMIVIRGPSNWLVSGDIMPGTLSFQLGELGSNDDPKVTTHRSTKDVDDWLEGSAKHPDFSRMWGNYYHFLARLSPFRIVVSLPFCVLVPIFAMLAATPWFRLRFSLRTLLIATTLVAVVLGLIVYVLRWPAG
jgi:hypothetical protein